MKTNYLSWLLLLFIFGGYRPLLAQQEEDIRIASVQVLASEENSSRRGVGLKTLQLNSSERLTISFDVLGIERPLLCYRLIPKEKDWSDSNESSIFAINGFDSHNLPDPSYSTNSVQRYLHYEVSFPNEYSSFRRSGNYMLEIYSFGDVEKKALISIPLLVVDPKVDILAEQTPNSWMNKMQTKQQVDILIRPRDGVNSFGKVYSVVVVQNGRWDNAVCLSEEQEGTRIGNEVSFRGNQGAIFDAGNEYHKQERLNSSGLGMGIQSAQTDLDFGRLSVVEPVDIRQIWHYRDEPDHDGIAVYRSSGAEVSDESAEYQLVYFSLLSPPIEKGDVVIDGEAFRYLPIRDRTLNYDPSTQRYGLYLPLKTGYQEFQFLYRPYGQSRMTTALTEGDFFQTTNTYTILVYERSATSWRDELVGVKTLR